MDWLSNPPIWTKDASSHNGHWVPAVEVYQEELADDGAWIQRYLVHDGSSQNRYPVDRTGSKVDLNDPQVLIDEWKLVRDSDGDQNGPNDSD